jgi:hypothetical protein
MKEGVLLCAKQREWRGANGRCDPTTLPPCCSESEQASLADLLVGQGVSKVFADRNGMLILDGVVERVKSRQPVFEAGKLVVDASIEYEAVYAGAPGGAITVTYTQKEAQGAHELYLGVQAREADARRLERDAAGKRERRSVAAAIAAAAAAARGDEVDDDVEEELVRGLRWPEIMDPEWWDKWGNKVSPSFHASLFGFPTPSSMRDFFEVFFDEEAKEPPPKSGLSQYEQYALALMQARRSIIVGWHGIVMLWRSRMRARSAGICSRKSSRQRTFISTTARHHR